MHAMIVRAYLRRSACICGCDRADFQKFQCKNRAVFDRKTAQVWCQKSAPHARNERRISKHAPHTVWHTPATFAHFWQALGACGRQKVRRGALPRRALPRPKRCLTLLVRHLLPNGNYWAEGYGSVHLVDGDPCCLGRLLGDLYKFCQSDVVAET